MEKKNHLGNGAGSHISHVTPWLESIVSGF